MKEVKTTHKQPSTESKNAPAVKKEPLSKEALGEEICSYCTKRADDPSYQNHCEGSNCDNAYEYYLDVFNFDFENTPKSKKSRKPREKYIPIAERFKTVGDLVWNERCQAYLDNRLKSITVMRNVSPGEGLRYKRGEYENLVEMGLWDAKAISQEFLLIDERKSNISSVLRRYIESLVIEGMNHTLEHYRAIETERETKKAKANENKLK